MGNHYRNLRRFGAGRSGGKSMFALLGGGIFIFVLAFALFSEENTSFKKIAVEGMDRVAAVCGEALEWGKGKLGLTQTSFALPVNSGVVVEEFGVVTDAEGKESYHKGIDIQVPAGSEVLSAADGKVSDIAVHDDGTYWVTVTHPQNWSTVYGRLGEVFVAEGDEVKKGGSIGVPANTILHFEVLEDDKEKDPVSSLEKGTDG